MDSNEVLLGRVEDWITYLWETVGTDALNWLRARGLTDTTIDRYYLGWTGGTGYYRDSISIPIFSATGGLRAVRFRRLSGSPKYDAPRGERAHLFNVGSVKHRRVFITEGEFDAMILEQMGFPAVGVPGAQNFKDEWAWLFVGNEVQIIYDGDEAGEKAARSLYQTLKNVAEHVEIIHLPEGEDVSSLAIKGELASILEGYER